MNEQAEVLIRAMVSAAKSDGQVDQSEQKEILDRLGHVGQEEIAFLQQEFARESDVRELAWNVPLGMEETGPTKFRLSPWTWDEQKEAHYLADLAHGLRLDPKTLQRHPSTTRCACDLSRIASPRSLGIAQPQYQSLARRLR